MTIRVKRVYDPPSPEDGRRVLVDRLWPRGLTKMAARIDVWAKDSAPSTALRRWYGHDPAKWEAFKTRYFAELAEHPEKIEEILQLMGQGTVTLLYGSKEGRFNNAHALKEFLESRTPPVNSS